MDETLYPSTIFTCAGETQGKCTRCKIRLIWRGLPRLKHATCPRCTHRLARTTGYSAYPVRRVTPHTNA